MLKLSRSAFTLLEMLAAITIIGIIAAVVLPRISVQAFDAKGKVCSQYVSDINSAIEQYYLDKGSFPTTVSELVPDYYPDVIPVCPAGGGAYTIDSTSKRVPSHSHGS